MGRAKEHFTECEVCGYQGHDVMPFVCLDSKPRNLCYTHSSQLVKDLHILLLDATNEGKHLQDLLLQKENELRGYKDKLEQAISVMRNFDKNMQDIKHEIEKARLRKQNAKRNKPSDGEQ